MLYLDRDNWLLSLNVEICAENVKICAKKCWNLRTFLIATLDIFTQKICKQTIFLKIQTKGLILINDFHWKNPSALISSFQVIAKITFLHILKGIEKESRLKLKNLRNCFYSRLIISSIFNKHLSLGLSFRIC